MAAISHRTGHLRIIACPGSGKTEVVSQRIAGLIEEGASPRSIVAFTFTEKAAEQLKTRIRGILQERCPTRADFGDMFIGTIHSFCFQILKEIDPTYRSFDVLDDARRVAFVSKGQNYFGKIGLVRLKNAHHLRHYETIDKFLDSADIVMTEDIDPARLSDKRFAECYLAYRKVLEEEKYFDFSSIMHTFVSVMKSDPDKRRLLHERIKHVVVDEYQDVNRIQEQLVELLSEGADSVCVVGDDDQNIYHWRGSDVEIIRTFKSRYEGKYDVKDVHLSTNFRSTASIIHTASSFIRHNNRRLAKKMMPSESLERKYEDGDIVHRHFPDDNSEFSFIADKIVELHGTDFLDKCNRPFSLSYSDFAILVRTNDDAARIVDFLDAKGIKCIAYSGTSVFERPEVLLAMNCIAYVFDCPAYPGYSTEVPKLEDLKRAHSQVFDSAHYPEASASSFAAGLEKVKRQAAKIIAKGEKDYFGDLGLQGFYYKILNAMGAEDFDLGEVQNYNLASLSLAISDYESVWVRLRASEVKWFFGFVQAFARRHYAETVHSDTTIIDAVHVLTIHKAKGLEFPVVFIPNFEKKQRRRNNTTFVDDSLYDIAKYQGDIEDDRRVYYTAMTRSEKYLFITGSERQSNRVKSYEPHPFLHEIDKQYFSDTLSVSKSRSGHPPKVRTVGTFPTSFSHLSCYGRCPQDFRLRHVFKYNAGVPVTFGYGTNIHNALNIIHTDFIRAKKVPTEDQIDAMIDRIFKLRYATDKIAENMKKATKRVVKDYVRLHRDGFNRMLETEKKFEFVMQDALISGQIDLLKRVDEKGNVTEVEIIDFKTDRNDSVYKQDYEKQLKFYAIACLESLGLKPERAYVHHLGENKTTDVSISPPELEKTRQEIREQVANIMSRKFPASPKKSLCSDCDYRVICPYKKFKTGIPPL